MQLAGLSLCGGRDHALCREVPSEVLELIIDNNDIATIAEKLIISVGTVKVHAHRIYQKVGVTGRPALMNAFAAFGRSSH